LAKFIGEFVVLLLEKRNIMKTQKQYKSARKHGFDEATGYSNKDGYIKLFYYSDVSVDPIVMESGFFNIEWLKDTSGIYDGIIGNVYHDKECNYRTLYSEKQDCVNAIRTLDLIFDSLRRGLF